MSAAVHPTLHKAVLAGVSRAPLSIESADSLGVCDEMVPLLQNSPEEALLWHAIAATDIWQRAGYVPPSLPEGSAALADERSCPAPADHMLQLLLRGLHPELLESWMALALRHQLRLPHASIPALLDMGLQKPGLRTALLPLLDKRGQWLVAQNPVWAKRYGLVAGDDVQTKWTLGNLADRKQALLQMREADPVAALAALQADWPNESPENRAGLLPCLATGLSLADEAFLEQALDDKRKEVRTAAQQMLAGLPGSQLMQRCIARLAPLLDCKKKLLIGSTLTVNLPEVCDKTMTRDGIGGQKHAGLGEKAGWLRDLMVCVDPTHWSTQWGLPAADVLKLMAKQEFKQALLHGLAQAAIGALQYRQSEAAIEWYEALLAGVVAGQFGIDPPQNLIGGFASLPATLQQTIMLSWLQQWPQDWQSQQSILSWCQQATGVTKGPWSAQISHLLIQRLQACMLASAQQHWILHALFTSIPLLLDLSDTQYFEKNWPPEDWPHWPNWRKPIDDFLETLRFRNTMQRSFLETTT